MIQPRTQIPASWGAMFALNESDIEQIYNHFLEVERPLTVEAIAHEVIAARLRARGAAVKRQLDGYEVYKPAGNFTIGDKVVFSSLGFAQSTVTAVRPGHNPEYGDFTVFTAVVNDKTREFAADLNLEHPLNNFDISTVTAVTDADIAKVVADHGEVVTTKVETALTNHDEFIKLSGVWFIHALMPEVNIGHLHLAEAILEMNEGGPMSAPAILVDLGMDDGATPDVQAFALNYHMMHDDRFDEVAPVGEVAWFLRRLEPNDVNKIPERLVYKPTSVIATAAARKLLSIELKQLERELDDEWSIFESSRVSDLVVFSLTFPHRWAGTIPFSARTRPLFLNSNAPRQRVIFIDEFTGKEIVGWVVRNGRYVTGLKEWYKDNNIPVGGFVHLKPSDTPGKLILGYDKRKTKKEWVRLATVSNKQIRFELKRRNIGCGYDDLLNVGTDVVAAIDALWKQATHHNRSIADLLNEIFPELVENPQSPVHAKTLYSAINMLRRLPPAQLFIELTKNPAFKAIGNNYWLFDSKKSN